MIWTKFYCSSIMLGPAMNGFWTTAISRDYHLVFCDEGVIAVPAKLRESAMIGVIAALSPHSGDILLSDESMHHGEIHDEGDSRWVRFLNADIASIITKQSIIWRHKIIVEMKSEKRFPFSLYIRSDFERIVQVLETRIPNKLKRIKTY